LRTRRSGLIAVDGRQDGVEELMVASARLSRATCGQAWTQKTHTHGYRCLQR
jgi:hypothetical protein